MALTNNVERKAFNDGKVISYTPAATGAFYKGALVNIAAAGALIPAADTASTFFAGIVREYVENAAIVADSVQVIRDITVWLPLTSAAETDMGSDVFAIANDEIALTATNVQRCGIIIDVDVANAMVLVDLSKGNVA